MDSDEVDPGPLWSVGDSEEEDDALMTAFSEVEAIAEPESPGSSQNQDTPTGLASIRKIKLEKQQKRRSVAEAPVLHEGWLKYRGPLRQWHNKCPGLLVWFKSPPTNEKEKNNYQAVILLKNTQVRPRPSKKPGFCFKISAPDERQSIWSPRGLRDESLNTISYQEKKASLILRRIDADMHPVNEEPGNQKWLDAITGAASQPTRFEDSQADEPAAPRSIGKGTAPRPGIPDSMRQPAPSEARLTPSPSEEKPSRPEVANPTNPATATAAAAGKKEKEKEVMPSNYSVVQEIQDNFDGQLEEKLEENSSSVFRAIVRQLRPGMDLSRVALPTFILETRSTLEKLTDYLLHGDILSEVPRQPDPLSRILKVLKWYISGYYLKPPGVKKPYNPLLGEVHRCVWELPTGSKIHFVSEQVTHHPPVSALYASNRVDGWTINGAIAFRSRLTPSAAAQAVLEGTATLRLLELGEEYIISFPTGSAKGFLFGTLTMELIGKVFIECPQTGYVVRMEFKSKPWIGGEYNCLGGEVTQIGAKRPLYLIQGYWDTHVELVDNSTKESRLLWNPEAAETRKTRLPVHRIPVAEQGPYESERVWQEVTRAIKAGDQFRATEEKSRLEEDQRSRRTERAARGLEWQPRLFEQDARGRWVYKYLVDSKFDPTVEVPPFEAKGVIASTPEHLRLLPTLPDVVLQPVDPLDLGVSVPQRREEREARDAQDRERERRERHERGRDRDRDRDRDREKDSLAPRGSRRGRPSRSPKRASESSAELQLRLTIMETQLQGLLRETEASPALGMPLTYHLLQFLILLLIFYQVTLNNNQQALGRLEFDTKRIFEWVSVLQVETAVLFGFLSQKLALFWEAFGSLSQQEDDRK